MPVNWSKVLIIEDNPGDARLIREMLLESKSDRITLVLSQTLKEGLAHIQNDTFDIILLDLSLPDSHGLDTLGQIYTRSLQIPIIVLTGNTEIELGVEAVKRGAQDYLAKEDVDSKVLIRAIRYAILRHQTEMALRQSEEEYRSLINDVFDTSMVAVIILDKDFRVVWCNAATEFYFGIERDRLLGKDKRVLIDEELKCAFADPDDYSNRLLKAYAEGEFTDRFECHVLVNENRHERWLEHWSQPIRNGMFAGGRIEQYTDITDRKLLEFAEQEQREFAEALHDIATVLTSSLDLDDVLGRILSTLGSVVPHDTASITILEEDHVRIARYRTGNKRDTQEIVAERQLQVGYKPFLDQMFNSQQPLIVSNLHDEEYVRSNASQTNLHAYVGVPILLQNKIIGFVNLFSETMDFYAESHSQRLLAFAELAAIAIQNARLYQQSQELAALEERQRLARELHDSVSQTLFTSRTMAETALRRWDKDPQRAHELTQEVHDLITSALAEMRILLLELRPAALAQTSLKQLFEQYLQPIQDRRKFHLTFLIDEIAPLPPDVQIALYRITQEALNNIDKHAQATKVEVRVIEQDNCIELSIQDDGKGFDVESISATSLGVGIMRERAEKIGAALEIRSNDNQGTSVHVVWGNQESE